MIGIKVYIEYQFSSFLNVQQNANNFKGASDHKHLIFMLSRNLWFLASSHKFNLWHYSHVYIVYPPIKTCIIEFHPCNRHRVKLGIEQSVYKDSPDRWTLIVGEQVLKMLRWFEWKWSPKSSSVPSPWNCLRLEGLGGVALLKETCVTGEWVLRFQKPVPGTFSLSIFLLPAVQEFSFQLLLQQPCLLACHHTPHLNGYGLNLWTVSKPFIKWSYIFPWPWCLFSAIEV